MCEVLRMIFNFNRVLSSLLLLSFLFFSCSERDVFLTSSFVEDSSLSLNPTKKLSAEYNMPFSSKGILDSLPSDDLLSWKTARALAVMRLANSREEQDWFGARLSEVPIIIYDAENSKPKYYEFIVMSEQGEAIGTITTYAFLTGITDGVHNLMPFICNYVPQLCLVHHQSGGLFGH